MLIEEISALRRSSNKNTVYSSVLSRLIFLQLGRLSNKKSLTVFSPYENSNLALSPTKPIVAVENGQMKTDLFCDTV